MALLMTVEEQIIEHHAHRMETSKADYLTIVSHRKIAKQCDKALYIKMRKRSYNNYTKHKLFLYYLIGE